MNAIASQMEVGARAIGGPGVGKGRAAAEALLVIAVMVVPVMALGAMGDKAPPWLVQVAGLSILPVAALASWLLMRAEGSGWQGLGLGRPKRRAVTLGTGLAVAAGIVVASRLIITPLVGLAFGRWLDPALFDPLAGNLGALVVNVLLISLLHAALCEEVIFRGFLLQRLERALGGGPVAVSVAVVAQALLFGLAHLDKGAGAAAATTAGGILFAVAFLLFGRNLWVTVIGHAALNTFTFTLVYLGMHRLLIPG